MTVPTGARDRAAADRNFHAMFIAPVLREWEDVKKAFRDPDPDMPPDERRYLWRQGENCAALLGAWGAALDREG